MLRCLELLFRVRRVMGQRVELAEQQAAFDIVALQLHNLGVFGDGELQNLLRRAAILNIAQRLQVDTAQQLVGFEIVGLGLEYFLGRQHGIPHPAGAQIELRQAVVEVFRAGIGVQRQLVFFNRARGVLGPAIISGHILVHVRQAEVVVSRRAIRFLRLQGVPAAAAGEAAAVGGGSVCCGAALARAEPWLTMAAQASAMKTKAAWRILLWSWGLTLMVIYGSSCARASFL